MDKLTEWLTKPFLEQDILNEGSQRSWYFQYIHKHRTGIKSFRSRNYSVYEKINVSKTGLKMVNQDSELEMLLKKYFGTTDIDNITMSYFKI